MWGAQQAKKGAQDSGLSLHLPVEVFSLGFKSLKLHLDEICQDLSHFQLKHRRRKTLRVLFSLLARINTEKKHFVYWLSCMSRELVALCYFLFALSTQPKQLRLMTTRLEPGFHCHLVLLKDLFVLWFCKVLTLLCKVFEIIYTDTTNWTDWLLLHWTLLFYMLYKICSRSRAVI